MKRKNLFFILMLVTTIASAQTLNCMGTVSTLPAVSNDKPTNLNQATAGVSGLACDSTIFWATDYTGQVYEFHINGGVVTNNGVVVASSPGGLSLAVGDNMIGGLFSPTFYSSSAANNAYIYDGSSWLMMPGNGDGNCPLYDATARGTDLFYYYNNAPNCIYQYKDTTFTLIDTSLGVSACVADIAIDSANNIYSFLGTNSDSVQYIKVINASGQLVKRYNFSMNTRNAYGCFFLSGILYVGLGSNNLIHPNTLIPITFTTTIATGGAPIPMPALSLSDFASCVPGNPLAVASFYPNDFSFTINPNPVSNYLTLSFDSKEKIIPLMITDMAGRIVYRQEFQTNQVKNEFKINTSKLASGCYFIHAADGWHNFVKKFIKL